MTIAINGHKVELVDGTPSQGIGQLGPYAVQWQGIPTRLEVVSPGDFKADAYGSILWTCAQDKTTRHTRWARVERDEP